MMNSFFVPQLDSMIHTMAGMVTQLHLQADHLETFRGLSSNFSGEGFSDMRFTVNAMDGEEFSSWVCWVRCSFGPPDPERVCQKAVRATSRMPPDSSSKMTG